MSDTQALQDDVVALGILVGLLTKSGSSYNVNLDWFKNPPRMNWIRSASVSTSLSFS